MSSKAWFAPCPRCYRRYDSRRMSLQHMTTNSQELWDERHLQAVPPGPYATISVPVGHTNRTDHCSVRIHYETFLELSTLTSFLALFTSPSPSNPQSAKGPFLNSSCISWSTANRHVSLASSTHCVTLHHVVSLIKKDITTQKSCVLTPKR